MRIAAIALLALTLEVTAQDRRIAPTPGRRLALVIGNQTYPRKPLRNSRADAQAMDQLLRTDLGFTDVKKVEDTNLVAMQRAIREFVRKVRPGDLALFYYSGHGMQVGRNNWMIPVDFHADFEDDVPDQAYSAQRVLADLEEAGATVRILILDACRDNPLPAAARKSTADGLLPMKGAEGTYLLFATAENQTASDNPRGSNGLFTSFLMEAMRRPGVSLDQAFKETRREVAAATANRQRPWLATDIDRDIVLRPGSGPQTMAVPAAPAAASPGVDPATEAWTLIKTSQSPDDFDQFASMFPSSGLAASAKLRSSQLRRALAPEMPKVTAPSTPDRGPALLAFQTGDYANAARLLRPLAQSGDTLAQAKLGELYMRGWGVSRDYDEAVRWMQPAAEQGEGRAMALLAGMCRNGYGVPKNNSEGMRWAKLAMEKGEGRGYAVLGAFYATGAGVRKDEVEAVRLFRKAAELGDPLGMNNLALMLQEGRGGDKDIVEAARLFRRSADLGEPAGMRGLALLYANGTGVVKDEAEAMRWVQKAADLNDQAAIDMLAATKQPAAASAMPSAPQTAAEPVWELGLDHSRYTIQADQTRMEIRPLTPNGLTASLKVSTDKKGVRSAQGIWRQGNAGGYFRVVITETNTLPVMLLVPTGQGDPSSCTSRTGAVLGSMGAGMNNQGTPCQAYNSTFVRVQ